MIHDNNCAGREIAAPDLINLQDRGKSIPDFITNKSRQRHLLSADTHTKYSIMMIQSNNSFSTHEYTFQCEVLTFVQKHCSKPMFICLGQVCISLWLHDNSD